MHNLLLFNDTVHRTAGTGGRLIACNIDNAIRAVSLGVDFECGGCHSIQPILSTVLEIKIILFLLNKKEGVKKEGMGTKTKTHIPKRVS